MGDIINKYTPIGLIGKAAGVNVGDTLLGQKDPGQAAETIDFNSAKGTEIQNNLLDKMSGIAGQDFGKIAANQVAQQENQARQNVQDNTMRARDLVAQRGLGGTSMGINAVLSQGKDLGNQIGAIRATQPGLENQLGQQGLGFASQNINQILGQQSNAKLYSPAVSSKGRQGGLAPLLGGAAGAYLGGPGGAQAGMGMGQLATQIG